MSKGSLPPSRSFAHAAVVLLTVVATSRGSRAATLVPGGGNARTDCVLQLSGEGVGFPAGKTAKGISCADGDVCDLDGRRNGVCTFQLSFCVNEPTRSCQPRSVTQAKLKTNKKPPIDLAPLQAALAALPLPTSATVCSATTLVSVPLAGPNKKGVVPVRRVTLKASAKAGGTTDSDTYKLTCQVNAADITCIPTAQGWLYMAGVIDLCSRKLVGWAAADHMETDLVAEALLRAIEQRKPAAGLLHHSDRGSQYASVAYQGLLARHGIAASMSGKGDCWDNACMESFWSTLKTELVHHEQYATRQAARASIFEYIEVFYNRVRLHSSLGYVSPESFEAAA